MKYELQINKWKTFKFSSIFDIKKGFYNKKPEESENGNIPFVGATERNNGVTSLHTLSDIEQASKTGNGRNSPIEDKIFPPHAVCVTNNGSVGYAYYHSTRFTCSHDVNPLYRKDGVPFNEKTGLFIATVIMQDRYRWGYGRKWRPMRMKDSTIKLPATENGNPDWSFMELFIETLESKEELDAIRESIRTESATDAAASLIVSEWKEFYLHELFNVTMGNGIDAGKTSTIDPKYNYVSRNSNDNGVVAYIDEIDGQELFPKGAITIALGGSYLGSSFIQKKPFYTAQNVGVLIEKEPLSDAAKLFITTLIRNEAKAKFQAFGRELNAHFRKSFILKLPVRYENGKPFIDKSCKYSKRGYVPDWDFMHNYVSSLPYGDRVKA